MEGETAEGKGEEKEGQAVPICYHGKIHKAEANEPEGRKIVKNPCKACAEYCMGLCCKRIEYLEWYSSYCEKVRKQIKDVNRRGEHGQECVDPVR